MKATVKGVKITGMCATVPAQVSRFEDEIKNFPFPEKTSRRLGKVMGFREHRITDPQTTPCDLASYTLDYLFKTGKLCKETIPVLIVVASSFDYFVPGNSKVIHGQLSLSHDTHCVDMYENCLGFLSGLHTASSMITAGGVKQAVLVTTAAGGYRANHRDRNTFPLIGDGASVTVIEPSDNPDDRIDFLFKTDGSRYRALIVPAGGLRMPYSAETAIPRVDAAGNSRSLNDWYMDGTAVFQFVMEEVPSLVREVCRQSGVELSDIQYHLTHQPNRFMLQRLADLMGVPREILFNNVVENFGNSSSSTIPIATTFNLASRLLTESPLVCFAAFGAGLSLGAAVTHLGPLKFCELIEHPGHGAAAYVESV